MHREVKHVPVLLKEVVEGLDIQAGEVLLDGTLGGGGHSLEVTKRLNGALTIVGIDRDKGAIERAGEVLQAFSPHTHLIQNNYRNMDKVLEDLGISGVDAILLDLGISSDQIDTAQRGFSFLREEPLLMTMEEDSDLNACKILNLWSEETLELIIRGFGEERHSKRIAKAIVERRERKPFETTRDLVDTVLEATPAVYHRGRIHPATRTFQAIRIAVNGELDALEEGLSKGFALLNPGGRFCVISFHSLEDRMVKNFFRDRAQADEGTIINKKPITPSEDEVRENPRSRSAKLRVIEKI